MAELLGLSHSIFIILITVGISIWAWQDRRLMDRLILWSPAVNRGQYDRFVSSGFIHADGMHLLFNMMTLFFFGRAIEALYKPLLHGLGFVLFYISAIIVASIPSYLKNKHNPQWASLGASGGVSAILFAFILFHPWNLIFVFFVPVPAIIFAGLYIAYSVWADQRGRDNINHSAHLWGAGYGVLITILIEPSVILTFLYRLTHIPSYF